MFKDEKSTDRSSGQGYIMSVTIEPSRKDKRPFHYEFPIFVYVVHNTKVG